MIALSAVTVTAGSFRLKEISFRLEQGEYGVLMGKTGSGKTTLLEAICGLKPITGGEIRLLDRDVTHLKPAQRGVGYVPQDRALFSTMTVFEHMAFPLRLRRWPNDQIEARVVQLAELLGILPLLDRYPRGLSGGESQRVALGRALAYSPPVLLLDEPLSALDEDTKEDMCTLLHKVQSETGVTTLHVTHSLVEAHRLADRIFVIRNGSVLEVDRGTGAAASPDGNGSNITHRARQMES